MWVGVGVTFFPTVALLSAKMQNKVSMGDTVVKKYTLWGNYARLFVCRNICIRFDSLGKLSRKTGAGFLSSA